LLTAEAVAKHYADLTSTFKELLMRKHLISIGLSVALMALTGLSRAQFSPNNTPQAGQWELSSDMKGMPFGGGVKTGKVCIKAEALADGYEKAMMEAAMLLSRPTEESQKDTPKCKFTDLQRETSTSRWKSSCEGPRGPMQGTGTGTFNSENTQLTQNFEVSMFGKRTITQTVAAKRLGDCT
jgi:Protein of unknown function (DUF3617)